MLPPLIPGQKVFIEITNPVHGGNGWEFGTCLWSPVYNKAGHRSWETMRKVSPSDIVIHLLHNKKEYNFAGVSKVTAAAEIITSEPPKAERWSGRESYYRVDLTQFLPVNNNVPISNFFKQFNDQLIQAFSSKTSGRFYVHYKKERLQVAEGYIFQLNQDEYDLFSSFTSMINYNYSLSPEGAFLPTANEPAYPDMSPPAKVSTIVSRTVRDTKMSRDLKSSYNHICQICGRTITLPNGKRYAEGHHLQPLGSSHNGPDIAENLLILCPFHHTEFDYGSISIHPESLKIKHIDQNNIHHGTDPAYLRNDLGKGFLEYHYKNIFANT